MNKTLYPYIIKFDEDKYDHRREFFPEEFSDLLEKLTLNTFPPKIKECTINEELYHDFEKILAKNNVENCSILVLDVLEERFSFGDIDRIFYQLVQVLLEKTIQNPKAICIATKAHENLEHFAYYKDILNYCNSHSIALIAIPEKKDKLPYFLYKGSFPVSLKLPALNPKHSKQPKIDDIKITESDLNILFGHFEINIDEKNFHSNAIFSLKNLTNDQRLIKTLKDKIIEETKCTNFLIHPYSWQTNEIINLANALVDSDSNRIIIDIDKYSAQDEPIVILSDILSQHYNIKKKIELAEKKSKTVYTLGIVKFKDFKTIKRKVVDYILESNFKIFSTGTCSYCKNNVELVKDNNFTKISTNYSKYNTFDSYTFWEFLSQDKNFYKVDHIPFKRTGYHYNFVIDCKQIFPKFSYTIATRMKNLLLCYGIKLPWIKYIMCPDDEETLNFVKILANVLTTNNENDEFIKKEIITIPREFIIGTVANDPGKKVEEHLELQYGWKLESGSGEIENKIDVKENLKKRKNDNKFSNVIIVDQAAHHFNTLSKLRYICRSYEVNILAICLFINRTDINLLNSFRNDKEHHFLDLFSFAVQPHTYNTCFCYKLKS